MWFTVPRLEQPQISTDIRWSWKFVESFHTSKYVYIIVTVSLSRSRLQSIVAKLQIDNRYIECRCILSEARVSDEKINSPPLWSRFVSVLGDRQLLFGWNRVLEKAEHLGNIFEGYCHEVRYRRHRSRYLLRGHRHQGSNKTCTHFSSESLRRLCQNWDMAPATQFPHSINNDHENEDGHE